MTGSVCASNHWVFDLSAAGRLSSTGSPRLSKHSTLLCDAVYLPQRQSSTRTVQHSLMSCRAIGPHTGDSSPYAAHIHLPHRRRSMRGGRRQFFWIKASAASEEIEVPITAKDVHKNQWQDRLDLATSLYPLYVGLGGILAVVRPSSFTWFCTVS
jgi:hypothetical protein